LPERHPDADIVALIRAGSGDEGIRLLLERHGGPVKGALENRFREMHDHDLEQAIHDGAIRLWGHVDEFDHERGTLRKWLLTTCKNYLLDQLRLRHAADLFESTDLESFEEMPQTEHTRSEWISLLVRTLRACIPQLSPMQQDLILSNLANSDDGDEQFANRWDTTTNTIRVARFKVRARLGDLMREALR
jgi:RNA polymerase sigma factor (sigma-70 family)